MSIKKITVPAAGVSKNVNLTGRAAIVASVPLYENIDQVPRLSFDSAGDDKPTFPGAVYNNGSGGFNKLVVTGTAESEGDSIYIYTSTDCLTEKIPIQFSRVTDSSVGSSLSFQVGDDVGQLSELDIMDADGLLPEKIYISARKNDIVFSFLSDPQQDPGGLGTVLKAGGEQQPISGLNFIKALRFRAKVAAADGILTIHREL